MASLVNELDPLVSAITNGNYSGQKVYTFKTEADANTYFLLAYTSQQAGDMADQIAEDLTETISTAVALQSVYVQSGIQQP